MPDVKIKIYDENKNISEFKNICVLNFEADRYSAYTELYVKISCDNLYKNNISRVTLEINGIKIHDGFCDILKSYKRNECYFIIIRSKSFTALLKQNYLKPGLYSDISFNDLMENYITLPYVAHEDNNTKSYIYVSDNKSIWDSVKTLSYKLFKAYPYITNCNKINISKKNLNSSLTLSEKNITETGVYLDYKQIISDIYMQDAAGEYEKYSSHSPAADKLNIKRKRQIPLDMQFLNTPEEATEFRLKYENSPIKYNYIKCSGYYYAEIYYKLNCKLLEINSREIAKIIINASSTGFFTYYYFI